MPAKLSTTLNKLDSVSECNRALLREFYENWQSKGVRSKRHINNLLTLAISFDKFFGGKPFTEINAKQHVAVSQNTDVSYQCSTAAKSKVR